MYSVVISQAPGKALPHQASRSAWVLDFAWETFDNTSPDDFENMFIKAGDSDKKEELR